MSEKVDAVVAALREHYQNTPEHLEAKGMLNTCGGVLHGVADDGNLEDEDLRYCIDSAQKCGDTVGEQIAVVLLGMTMEEREAVYARYAEYGMPLWPGARP